MSAGEISGCNDSGCWVRATRLSAVWISLEGPPRPHVLETTWEDGGGGNSVDGNDDCDIDQAAIEGSAEVKEAIEEDGVEDTSTAQTEYGRVGIDRGSGIELGSVVRGQSYAQSNPPSTNLTPSLNSINGDVQDVVAIIHSHGPSGVASVDARNQGPSEGDWALADSIVARGADPFRLTLYIIDKDGTMRAYRYQPPHVRGTGNANVASSPIARSC